jgi:O-acetyl-ADP-ribose deacetylase (regulator of RNase III)
MKLILCDVNTYLCNAWNQVFAKEKDVEVVRSRFEDVPEYDCMVSPANSFGLMDGGIDAAITAYFGQQLMQRVQDRIMQKYCGEQPVGTAIIVPTGNKTHPWLAHTPTMRVPRNIYGTDNVYNAMRAMLLAVRKGAEMFTADHDTDYGQVHAVATRVDIKTVLCPGFGTGTGGMPPYVAACQMYLAYQNVMEPRVISWDNAIAIEQEIYR